MPQLTPSYLIPAAKQAALRGQALTPALDQTLNAASVWLSDGRRDPLEREAITKRLRAVDGKVPGLKDATSALAVMMELMGLPLLGKLPGREIFVFGDPWQIPDLRSLSREELRTLQLPSRQALRAVAGPDVTDDLLQPKGPPGPSFPSAELPLEAKFEIAERFADTPLETYRNFRWAWWREVLQNSIDAKATRIDLVCRPDGNEFLVSAEDNGTGMTPEVLRQAFLSLGGSGKQSSSGATGGFGKAKELLLLPWLGWAIKTVYQHADGTLHELTVQGRGIRHTQIQERVLTSGHTGTLVMARTHADPARRPQAEGATLVASKSYVPNVELRLNGEPLSLMAGPRPGKVVKVWEADDKQSRVEVQVSDESVQLEEVPVRQNGLYMFDLTSTPEGVKGVPLIECFGRAAQFFTDNRDAFNGRYNWDLNEFVRKLAVEGAYALRVSKKPWVRVYRGKTLEELSDPELTDENNPINRRLAKLLKAEAEAERKRTLAREALLSKQEATDIYDVLAKTLDEMERKVNEHRPVNVLPMPGEMDTLSRVAVTRNPLLLSANMMWAPQTIIRAKHGALKTPPEIDPESSLMSPYAKSLLHLWAVACRWSALAIGVNLKGIGIGFVLDWDEGGKEAEASFLWNRWGYEGSDEEDLKGRWLVVNPVKATATGFNTFGDPIAFDMVPRYDLRDEDHLSFIAAMAIHEVTHASGIGGHNVEFAYALTHNMVHMPSIVDALTKLAADVLKRYPHRKPPEAKGGTGERDQRLPAAGSYMTRKYKDLTYVLRTTETAEVELLVLDGGVPAWKRYGSISGAARAVTGTATNGFAFFRHDPNYVPQPTAFP